MTATGTGTLPSPLRTARLLIGLMLILGGAILAPLADAYAQNGSGEVHVIRIDGTIDLGLAPFLARVLSEAAAAEAEAVILDIHTPGGRLDAALEMQNTLLEADVRTIAFVNRQAYSAGALIAIASEEIYMTPGAVMGAAMPVTGDGQPADEKTVSAVRSAFRATAEARGRDPRIAEAMVDPNVVVEGLVGEGQILTLTTEEALEWGYAEGTAANLDELLAAAGLEDATVQTTAPSWAEQLVRVLTHPIIASLLFSMGALFILVDIFSGDLGIFSAVGVGLLATFFWGHFLVGLAGWEGVLLVIVGLALIAVEVFILPGFGIAGILGLASLLGGLFFSLVGQEIVTDADLERAGVSVLIALLAILLGGLFLIRLLPRVGAARGLILQARLGETKAAPPKRQRGWLKLIRPDNPDVPEEPAAEPPPIAMPDPSQRPSLVGARGRALSDLRPGGIATINGDRIDVVSRGDYIRAGDWIEVVQDESYRRVVRRLDPSEIQNPVSRPAAGGDDERARLRELG